MGNSNAVEIKYKHSTAKDKVDTANKKGSDT